MNHKLEDLIDVKLLQELQDKLNVIYSFPSAIIDNDGKILTAVAWQDICTKFHRINPESEKECIKSDQYILDHLHEANPAVSYKCPHGMMDNATPIIIDGKHLGNFFTGQLFLEQPDLEFFKKQAARFGFNEKEYLEAVQKVPVWTKEKLNQYLDFIKSFIEIVAGIGLKNLKEKETNISLNLSEERYKAIIECTSDWVWEIDEKGKYCFCSDNVENLLGYKAEEILGKTPFDLMLPEDVEKNKKAFLDLIAAKSAIVDFENWNLHKDGHHICLLTNGFPVFDEMGNVIGYKGADKDITERKQAELVLQNKNDEITEQNKKLHQINLELTAALKSVEENESKLKTIFETLTEGVALNKIIYNNGEMVDYEIVQVNNAYYKIGNVDTTKNVIGAKATELYGMSTDFIKEFWKNHKDNSNAVRTEMKSPVEDRWFYISTSPFVNDNFVTAFFDITQHKLAERKLIEAKEKVEESERRFNLAMEASNDGLFDWNLVTNEIYYSPRWKSILGYEDHELPNDFSIWENNTEPEDVKKSWELQQKLVAKQIDRFVMDFKMKHKDGHWVDILSRAEAIFNESGKAVRIVGTHTDVSERKQAELLLATEKQRLSYILEGTNVGTWEWDIKTGQSVFNERWANIIGYTLEELAPLSINTWLKFAHPDDVEKSSKLFERHSNGEVEYYECEARMKHKNGNWVWILVRGKIYEWDNNGNPVKMAGTHQDITERKLFEERLYQSESKYRLQFMNMNTYNSLYEVVTDKDGKPCDFRFIMVNLAYEEYVGKKAHELIGKTLLEVYPETEKYWIDKMAQVVLTGEPCHFENFSSVLNAYTEINFYIPQLGQLAMTSANITERKRAEESLRKSEAIKNTMVSNIGDVIVIIDSNGINKYKSPNITKLFGWRPEELVGKNTWDNIHPGDLEAGQKFFGTVFTEPNATGTTELRYKRKDGNYVWIEISVINLLHDKDINGILGNYSDITERKNAQESIVRERENFLKLFAAAPIGLLLLNEETVITQANQAVSSLVLSDPASIIGKRGGGGLGCIESLENTKGCGFGSNCPLCPLRLGVQSVLNGGPSIYGAEIETTLLIGGIPQQRWLRISAEPINLDNKQNIIVAIDDITHRKRAEMELEKHRNQLEELVKVRTTELNTSNIELNLQLERQKEFEMMLRKSLEKEHELNEMKSRFISTTSHEFRTPLTAVLSSTELLQRFGTKWSDEKKNEHFNRIISSVGYLTHLLDDILTLNRTESGKISFNPEKLNLHQFVQECLADADLLIEDNHNLKLNYKSKQKEFVLDPKLMKFIFNNLLSNGIKYSPDGGVVTLNISKDKKHLVIEVSDEGIGIPSEDLDKIFDSFYRTKHGEDIAGTGLGLAIVKRAVELHNGEIKVVSELGKGTTFIVKIPIVTINE